MVGWVQAMIRTASPEEIYTTTTVFVHYILLSNVHFLSRLPVIFFRDGCLFCVLCVCVAYKD